MLQVVNLTRGLALVNQGRIADHPWTRFKGLIGVRSLLPGDGMLITPCSSVHCMWMSIPIDVLYVNKENHIVGIDHELKPWRIGHIFRGAQYVLELPAGTAKATKTQVGDQLDVRYLKKEEC